MIVNVGIQNRRHQVATAIVKYSFELIANPNDVTGIVFLQSVVIIALLYPGNVGFSWLAATL